MKRIVIALITITAVIICACSNGGTSAEELTKYYAEQAAKEGAEAAKEIAKDVAEEGVSKVNQAIDENETASKVKKGVTTAGEYAQDAYEYATDENTINSAKSTAKEVGEDSLNFFEYMIQKMERTWKGVVLNIEKGPANADSANGNILEDLENISEYDFYGNYTNPFKEAKGIDTSSQGTAWEQFKVAYGDFSKETKETIEKIKQNHDAKHPSSSSGKASNDSKGGSSGGNGGSNTQNQSSVSPSTSVSGNVVAQNTGEYTQTLSQLLLPIVPEYSGNPYCIVNNNVPFFEKDDLTTEPFIILSELDSLGRCGVAYMNACRELAPTEERGSIGEVKPTGWNQAKYDTLKDENDNPAGYYQCRCHLLAYTNSGLNAEPRNLISGTFYFNVDGMEPFELAISHYTKSTGHHVLTRVTPIFNGNELMARGVLMEAQSVEDNELSFCVFVYNVAPGLTIDYATGKSRLAE